MKKKKNKVQFVRFEDTQILVRFEGITRNLTKEKEVIDEIQGACVLVKEDPSEDNVEYLKGLLNPITRKEFSDSLDVDTNGNLYLKGTKEPLPTELTDLVKRYLDDGVPFDSLINFWELCLANPNEDARQGFYKYVKDFGIVITDNGYAILYKAVNVQSNKKKEKKSTPTKEDEVLSRFLNKQYLKIKNMKKSPKNYEVFGFIDDENKLYYKISTHKRDTPRTKKGHELVDTIGNLEEMYKEYIEKGSKIEEGEGSTEDITLFQPSNKGNHGMDIRMGVPVTMPRDKCDPNINNACSYGLHVGSHKYVKNFGSGMGAILAVLVNPKDVVALPRYDHSKIRVCQYFPYAEVERDAEGNWEEIPHGYFEEDYVGYELKDIKDSLKILYDAKSSGKEISTDEEAALNRRLVLLESNL